jgi:PPK2 family polyphosphate:nucleotide phosphotransferase
MTISLRSRSWVLMCGRHRLGKFGQCGRCDCNNNAAENAATACGELLRHALSCAAVRQNRRLHPKSEIAQMRIRSSAFMVPEAGKIKLRKWATLGKPVYKSKRDYRELLKQQVEKLSALQELHYASNRFALLLIFQGMDAAGKDGAIRHVMSGVNPQGVQVVSFKQPSAAELAHDFLWRTTRELPERGHIGIFNRSYYEEVLIARVHPKILRAEGLASTSSGESEVWLGRFRSIVDHERHLHKNGTRIVKFFLHLSKEEQRKRLLARMDDPTKNWKFSAADIAERPFWKEYTRAFEHCLSATSTKDAPWYIVPADDKISARLIVSQIMVDTLQELGSSYPTLDASQKRALRAVRRRLAK